MKISFVMNKDEYISSYYILYKKFRTKLGYMIIKIVPIIIFIIVPITYKVYVIDIRYCLLYFLLALLWLVFSTKIEEAIIKAQGKKVLELNRNKLLGMISIHLTDIGINVYNESYAQFMNWSCVKEYDFLDDHIIIITTLGGIVIPLSNIKIEKEDIINEIKKYTKDL